MENYELLLDESPRINRLNGRFIKGHKPFNKGVPMDEWMDERKRRKVLKYLALGRKRGNIDLPGANRIPIVGIKDGKIYPFDSAVNAAKILKAKGIKVNQRNINAVCNQRILHEGKWSYTRKKAGGFRWFFADQPEKYMIYLNQN